MKATIVVDNIGTMSLPGEWGLCIYIEHGDKKILLDTGASNLFKDNMEKLGIDIADIDAAILSHAHYDHANGMEDFLEANRNAKFYVQNTTAENCYFKMKFLKKYIGIPKNIMEKYKDRIIVSNGNEQIFEGVSLIPHTTSGLELLGKRERMYQKIGRKWYPDNYSHEQSLVFDTEKGLVIFNSCSHGGVINSINEVKKAFPEKNVYGYIGGFHIFKKPEAEIRELAEKIRQTGISYVCTGHCSGERGYRILHDELGDMVHQMSVGLVQEF